jgi:hypothetical protein
MLSSLPPSALKPLPSAAVAAYQRAAAAAARKAARTHHPAAPYPGATPVLARPYEHISGRRHVPILVSGNGEPFLRFKKPQSQYLSRIIRQKIEQRDKWWSAYWRMEAEVGMAEMEDVWEELVAEAAEGEGVGFERENGWERLVKEEMKRVMGNIEKKNKENIIRAEMLQRIVDLERLMAERERVERMLEKSGKRLERFRRLVEESRKVLEGSGLH